MTTQEINTLSNELTEKQINNVLFSWEQDGDVEQIRLYNSLVILGDSKPLALATTIADKYNKKDSDGYSKAYRGY